MKNNFSSAVLDIRGAIDDNKEEEMIRLKRFA